MPSSWKGMKLNRRRRPPNDSNTARIVFIIGTVLVLFFCFMFTAVRVQADSRTGSSPVLVGDFPPGFLLGVGSSSYQIEGAWDADGKGPSIWDTMAKRYPQSDNGDVACDSYHKIETDVRLLANLEVDFYRFSLSWPRILPTGDVTKVNQNGINYYNKLINLLLANRIQPVVTLYHWDLPQALQDLGGWTNKVVVDYFEDYANLVFKEFGDRVKWWITVNEPQLSSVMGYGHENPNWPWFAPQVNMSGIADYLAVHNLLLAHGRAYRLYQKEYVRRQSGKVGIAANLFGYKSVDHDARNERAAELAMIFEAGWILDPVYRGDYPEVMKNRIESNSKEEGRRRSRLPEFTEDEKTMLRRSIDFIGLNHYSSYEVWLQPVGAVPSFRRDSGVNFRINPKSKTSPNATWLSHEPDGLRIALTFLSKYQVPIFITENGCDDNSPDDTDRIEYHRSYLKTMLKSMKDDSIPVIGYTIWSFMDSFEWTSGYGPKFGIYQVNFSDPNRLRTPKKSFSFFKNLFMNRTIDTR